MTSRQGAIATAKDGSGAGYVSLTNFIRSVDFPGWERQIEGCVRTIAAPVEGQR